MTYGSCALQYDGALVMPRNFVVIENNEMEYLDGGAGVSKTVKLSNGYQFYMSSTLANQIIGYLTVGAGVSAIAAVIGAYVSGVGAAPGIVAGAICTIGIGLLTSANAQGRGVVVQLTLSWKPLQVYSQ